MQINAKNLETKSRSGAKNADGGFTLVEMLTVIAIIAILAALIIQAASYAKASAYRSRVKAEVNVLAAAIQRYKKDKGYYPPDSSSPNATIPSVQTPLFYELTGNVFGSTGFTNQATDTTMDGAYSTNNIYQLFNTGGFLNSAASASDTRNYYSALKAENHSVVLSNNFPNFTVFGTRVPGPFMMQIAVLATNGGKYGYPINPVHYNSSSPTNNSSSFDLWFDVIIQGKTNRISNWSDEPQAL